MSILWRYAPELNYFPEPTAIVMIFVCTPSRRMRFYDDTIDVDDKSKLTFWGGRTEYRKFGFVRINYICLLRPCLNRSPAQVATTCNMIYRLRSAIMELCWWINGYFNGFIGGWKMLSLHEETHRTCRFRDRWAARWRTSEYIGREGRSVQIFQGYGNRDRPWKILREFGFLVVIVPYPTPVQRRSPLPQQKIRNRFVCAFQPSRTSLRSTTGCSSVWG